MLKVKFGTAESKLKKHIGTNHSFCAQRRSDHAEKRNLLSAVPQFTFSSHAIYFQHFSYYQHRSTPTVDASPLQMCNQVCKIVGIVDKMQGSSRAKVPMLEKSTWKSMNFLNH